MTPWFPFHTFEKNTVVTVPFNCMSGASPKYISKLQYDNVIEKTCIYLRYYHVFSVLYWSIDELLVFHSAVSEKVEMQILSMGSAAYRDMDL